MIVAYPNGRDENGKQMIGIFVNGELADRLTMEQIAEMWEKLGSAEFVQRSMQVDEQEDE